MVIYHNIHLRQGGHRDAFYPFRRVTATVSFSPTTISSGRRPAVHQCAHSRVSFPSARYAPDCLERSRLHPAGDTVGFSRSGPQCRPFLSGCRGPTDRPSTVAGTEFLLPGNRCLLPGEEAIAGEVLL